MKACKWMGAVAAATLLLTSCLGEGDNSFSGSGFGVAGISETNYQPILYTAVGPMYSSATAALTPGTCWLVSYSVDLNSPENTSTSTSGAYYATISQMQEIETGAVYYSSRDTAALMPNEIALSNAGLAGGEPAASYIDGHLFLGAALNAYNNQINNFSLYWNQADSAVVEDNISTYSLYLCAVKQSDGTGSTASAKTEFRAFDLGSTIESIARKEGKDGAESFYLKIHYISEINEKDSTDLTWSSFRVACAAMDPDSEN